MIVLLPLLLGFLQVEPPAVVAPTEWSTLSELHYRRPWPQRPELSTFVRGEVAAARCPEPATAADGTRVLRVDMIVHVVAGNAQRIVPRAIGCPTVEQYATGLVSRMARGNVDTAGDGWFRTAITFAWSG